MKPSFFDALTAGELEDSVLLVLAQEHAGGEYVAGALNLIGDDCVYGR